MKRTYNEPAFPTEESEYSGMNLRDYFAAKAMQSMIMIDRACQTPEQIAKSAYHYADAMLEERYK